MKTIWKFEMPTPIGTIYMPLGAQIIRIARKGFAIYLWAIVESDSPTERRLFAAIGNGHPIPIDGKYLGTWDDGTYVWHLFEPKQ